MIEARRWFRWASQRRDRARRDRLDGPIGRFCSGGLAEEFAPGVTGFPLTAARDTAMANPLRSRGVSEPASVEGLVGAYAEGMAQNKHSEAVRQQPT
jgi:hypothetical protein